MYRDINKTLLDVQVYCYFYSQKEEKNIRGGVKGNKMFMIFIFFLWLLPVFLSCVVVWCVYVCEV